MDIEISNFIQDGLEDQDFARIMASSRHLARFEEGTDGSIMHLGASEGKTFKHMRKTHRRFTKKVSTEDRLVQNFEISKDFGSVNCQCRWTAVFYAPSSNENDEDDFDCGLPR